MKKHFCISILLTNCASLYQPEVWKHETSYTLRLHTGMCAQKLYEENFEAKAKKLCPKGYDVIEKSFQPSTLHENNHRSSYYNWVIKCL